MYCQPGLCRWKGVQYVCMVVNAGDSPSHQAGLGQKPLAVYAALELVKCHSSVDVRNTYPGRPWSLPKRWDQVSNNGRHGRTVVLAKAMDLDTDILERHRQTLLL